MKKIRSTIINGVARCNKEHADSKKVFGSVFKEKTFNVLIVVLANFLLRLRFIIRKDYFNKVYTVVFLVSNVKFFGTTEFIDDV